MKILLALLASCVIALSSAKNYIKNEYINYVTYDGEVASRDDIVGKRWYIVESTDKIASDLSLYFEEHDNHLRMHYSERNERGLCIHGISPVEEFGDTGKVHRYTFEAYPLVEALSVCLQSDGSYLSCLTCLMHKKDGKKCRAIVGVIFTSDSNHELSQEKRIEAKKAFEKLENFNMEFAEAEHTDRGHCPHA